MQAIKPTRPVLRYHVQDVNMIELTGKKVYNSQCQDRVAGLLLFSRPARKKSNIFESKIPLFVGVYPGAILADVQAETFTTEGFCFMTWKQKARHWPAGIAPNLRYSVDESTGCHVWQGALNESGYGIIGTNLHGTFRAHRVSFELEHGPLPDNIQLDHKCKNRACINPAHLEPVTNAENSQRGDKPKLNWPRVREIRQLYREQRIPYRQLARMFGVSSCAISNIINEKRWKE